MTVEFHPVSAIFPMLDADKLGELAGDIRDNGLREPIVLHPDGRAEETDPLFSRVEVIA